MQNLTIEQKAQAYDQIINFIATRCLADTRASFITNNIVPEAFINDPDDNIRLLLARKGVGLDVLVHDRNKAVRIAVADHYFGLDLLTKDPDPDVRARVASLGHNLNILKNDPDPKVRNIAMNTLRMRKN